jgi:hypothetical protein
MIASSNDYVRPHNFRPLRRLSGLFSRTVAKSHPVNVEKVPPSQVTTVKTIKTVKAVKAVKTVKTVKTVDSSCEKDSIGVGAALRNEKIENARSAANAARQQRQKDTANSSNMHNALVERLEAKLLAHEMECTELRELVKARRPLPVYLSLQPTEPPSVEDFQLREKLETLLLVREKECTKVRRLLVKASKRGEPETQKATCNRKSLAAHLEGHNTALRKQSSVRSKNSVLRKQKSSRSTKSSTKSVSWE